jgi:hypothetical protein
VNGLLVSYQDIDGLAAAIGRALDDQELRLRLAALGHEEALAKYGEAAYQRRINQLVANLAAEGRYRTARQPSAVGRASIKQLWA